MCGFLRGCGLYQPSPPTVRFADETPAGRPGPDPIRPRAAASPTRPPAGRAAGGPGLLGPGVPGYPCRCRTRRPEPSERRRLRGESPRSSPEPGAPIARPPTPDSPGPTGIAATGRARPRGDPRHGRRRRRSPRSASRSGADEEAPAGRAGGLPAKWRGDPPQRRPTRGRPFPAGRPSGVPLAGVPLDRAAGSGAPRRLLPGLRTAATAPPPLPAGASRASGPERRAAARGTGRGAVLGGSLSGEQP